MKIILKCLFISAVSVLSYAQTQNEIRASMGIDFISVPELKDYLETNYTEILGDFSSAVNFSGSYGRMIGEGNQLEIELGYLLNSYNASSLGGNYDLTYSLLMPSLIHNFVKTGSSYNFKFGAGAGLRLVSITEKLPADPNDYKYSMVGYGFILNGNGNTAIGQNVFAHIGVNIRYDLLGKPEKNSEGNNIESVNFSSLSFGIRLGVSYQF